MQIRKFDPEQDYETVAHWWKKREWPVVPLALLSKTAFIVEDDTQAYAAGWLYKTDSKFALLEWIIANPDCEQKKRAQSLDILISRLMEAARQGGFSNVFSSISNERLIERYKKHGFKTSDKGMTNMIARVD